MSFIEEKLIFANRLRQERERLGLMQKEMAQKLEIPPNTYNGYETGKRSPNLEVAKHISDTLEISVDYLLGRTDNRSLFKENTVESKETSTYVEEDTDIRMIQRARKNMSTKEKEKMIKVLQTMFDEYFD